MNKRTWIKATSSLWVSGEWAVEDNSGYAELYHEGESIWTCKSLALAKRGATQATLDRTAAERARYRTKPLGFAKMKVAVGS